MYICLKNIIKLINLTFVDTILCHSNEIRIKKCKCQCEIISLKQQTVTSLNHFFVIRVEPNKLETARGLKIFRKITVTKWKGGNGIISETVEDDKTRARSARLKILIVWNS